MAFKIRVKRVYESPAADDGVRLLIDRLWPRGLKRDAAALDGWLKEVAPSDSLRGWFAHEPARWDEFVRRYFAELDEHPECLEPILEYADQGRVTLLYASRDAEHNNAVALARYLEGRAPRSGSRR
ncbi:MAG: DUF488 family protein [Luteitalea sp.]|nr:DUF488 family protein [Luteitalea sp.]